MDKEKRQGYLSAIEMYLTTVLGYKVLDRVKRGLYIEMKGEKKSVYTEVGDTSGGSHSTFALPYSYKSKPFSVGVANTNYYAIIFPDSKLICVGRPKKIRLWVATTNSEQDRFTDDMGIEWVWVKRKSLDDIFDKVEEL